MPLDLTVYFSIKECLILFCQHTSKLSCKVDCILWIWAFLCYPF